MSRRVRIAIVPSPRAEAVRRELHALGLIDRTWKIRKRHGEVQIPLREDPPAGLLAEGLRVASMDDLEPRPTPRDPRSSLRERFEADGIPARLVPRHWERIGDVLVLRLAEEARLHATRIARAIGECLRATTVVEDVSGIHGPFREPDVRVLWGDGTETVHVEGGVRYRLDVAKVMFSSGNLEERMSIARRVGRGQVVVDLFAGIGYFAVPVAVRSEAAAVYACEVNPVAFRYLQENIALNRANRVIALPGDCRETAPRGVADWVVMGHFDSIAYLDVALRCLRREGTLVLHGLVRAEGFPQALVDRVRSQIKALGGLAGHATGRKVKSFAPGIVHAALEVHATTVPKGLSGASVSGVR